MDSNNEFEDNEFEAIFWQWASERGGAADDGEQVLNIEYGVEDGAEEMASMMALGTILTREVNCREWTVQLVTDWTMTYGEDTVAILERTEDAGGTDDMWTWQQ